MSREIGLSIGDVARRTDLTVRALRFYETHGLLQPLRSAAGRRVYGRRELLELARIALLRRAGFTLAQIASLVNDGAADPHVLVAAQMDMLAAQRTKIDQALALLETVRKKLDGAAAIDANTLCSLIKTGELAMQDKAWKKMIDKYYTKEEQEHWRKVKQSAFKGYDQQAYTKAWVDLNDRIAAALPLDPASKTAQDFLAEWNALLKPFLDVADDKMKADAGKFWSRMDEWQGEFKSPLSKEVYAFIVETAKVRKR